MDRRTPTVAELVRVAVEAADPTEGADYDVEDPGVAVATAVVLYLGQRGGNPDYDRDPNELIRLAVRTQWHGDRLAAR